MTLFDPSELPPAPPDGASVRVRMTVAYHGKGFHGFAEQQGVKTVGGKLRQATERVLGHGIELACAGRTDTGVHARGQVVSFDADPERLDTEALERSLNKVLAPAVAVREVAVAPPGFDARRSAVARRYRYLVLNSPYPDPLLADRAWHVEQPLDLRALLLTCDPVIGEHDFASFCRQPPGEGSTVRRVHDACWRREGDGLFCFEIEAGAFCHQMVRSLVGTMVEMGRGKKRAGEMAGIIRARDRSAAGQPAPPHGLCLWEVLY